MKNYLNIKTKKGIDKYTLYNNLSEIVGRKTKKVNATNEKTIHINNSLIKTIQLSENEDTVVSNNSKCTLRVYAFTCFSAYDPLIIDEENKVIHLNFSPNLTLNNEASLLLKDADFPFYAGKLHVDINLEEAGVSISKVNETEIEEIIVNENVYLRDSFFHDFIIEEKYFDNIFNFYTNKYKEDWKEKLLKDITESMECYYQEDEVEIKYDIKDRKINFYVEDIWERDYIKPNDLKLDYEVSYFDFEPEEAVVACILKKDINTVFDYKDFEKNITFKKINSGTNLENFYILQTLNSYDYLFLKNRIDGDVINISENYILKTAGNKDRLLSFDKEKIFTLEQEINNFNISAIYNKFDYKNGMCIVLTGGEGEYGEGEYSYKGGEGETIKYEFPNILINEKYLISLKKCGLGKHGIKGKTGIVRAKTAVTEQFFDSECEGKEGGEGGDSIELTVSFGDIKEREIAEGGEGGEGENIFSHLFNVNKTIEKKWKADFFIYK